MKLQQIADELRDGWNDKRLTPWYMKALIYLALGQCLLLMVYELTS